MSTTSNVPSAKGSRDNEPPETQSRAPLGEEIAGGLGKLYGRRSGHKLKARQAACLDKHLAALDLAGLPAEALAHPTLLFGKPEPTELWFEIGFGGGEHLACLAEARPEVGFIGAEHFRNGLAKLCVQIEDRSLKNIRLYSGDAKELLLALPDGCLSRIFVLFPDPWPKTRHHKRRMISDFTLTHFARVLRPGGLLRVASDIPDYTRWTLCLIARHRAFDWQAERPADWRERPADWPPTRYEEKALEAGRVPSFLTFKRLETAGGDRPR